MRKSVLIYLLLLPFLLKSQITTQPAVITETGKVEIIFNAAEGNQGLKGYTGTVYAHTGVITDKSSTSNDWKYTPAWGVNNDKYKLSSLGNNQWKLTISPGIRNWYGVPPTEKILKLAFVFRSSDSKKEGKGVGNSDIFVPLNENEFIPSPPQIKPRPAGIKDGINYINDKDVTLVLFAPGKEHVHLLGDFNNWKKDNTWQLYKDGDYWWYPLTGLQKGTEYAFQYLIDNKLKIADAYSEKILDPVWDKEIPPSVFPELKPHPVQTEGLVSILETGKTIYNWQATSFATPLPENLVIYELLIRDFTESGSIQAATNKLDYLKRLGVNAIELMPIQEFDGNDSWGYNPCFYFAPDKAYGTTNDYKKFIDEAHKRGMAVILDVVFNHTTEAHPFARLYWDGNQPATDNPWLNWQAPHPYSVFFDFNHEYEGTRAYFKQVLSYWLTEYKIDGFRFDLSKGFTQKQSTEATASDYDASRIAILKEYARQIRQTNPSAYTILEHFCNNTEENELAEAGMLLWGNTNKAYCQSIMGWKQDSDLSAAYAGNRGWTKPHLIAYQESHDEERTLYKAKTGGNGIIKTDAGIQMERAALNAAFLLCTPGPKMIWQFGELGYDYSIEENGRTGRKPVRWDYFDDPVRATLYENYSKLLSLRSAYPQVFSNPVKTSIQASSSDWDKGRRICLEHAETDVILIGNFTSAPIKMKPLFPKAGIWKDPFSQWSLAVSEIDKQELIFPLPAHSFRLFVHQSSGTANESIKANYPVSLHRVADHVFVQTPLPVQQITIYSVTGSKLKDIKNTSGFDLSELSSGIYLITIRTSQSITTVKLRK